MDGHGSVQLLQFYFLNSTDHLVFRLYAPQRARHNLATN